MMKKRLPAALALLCCFLFTVSVFAVIGRHFTDADMASEFVYADLLNREGSLHTQNWTYSSELRIVAPTPVYRAALALFPSWHTARTFSCVLLLLLFLFSAVWMLRPCRLLAGGLLTACIFAFPFAETYAFFVCYGCHYSVHLCIIFLLMGLLLRAERGKRLPLYALLSFLLALWGGIGGLRVAMMFAAPAALAVLWESASCLKGEDARAACSRLPRGQLLCILAVLAGSAAGILVNSRFLSSLFSFDSHAATPVLIPSAEAFFAHLSDLFSFFGLRESSRMLSVRGLVSFLSVALCLFCVFAVICQIRRGTAIPQADRLLARFSAAALAMGFLINLLTGNYGAQYYLAGLLAAIASADSFLACTQGRPKALTSLCAVLLAGCFALSAAVFVRQDMPHGAAPEEDAAKWLLENGYTKGYATFWHGAPITEASDGQIEIWVLEEPVYSDAWRHLGLNDILQEKRHYAKEPEGPVFVCLFSEETGSLPPWADRAHLAVRADWGRVYTYESAEKLHSLSR